MTDTKERAKAAPPVVTDSGIAIKPVYRAEDGRGPRLARPRPVSLHARHLPDDVSRAAAGRCASTPASPRRDESNRALPLLLEQGQTGLSVAFDLPTQIGYDSDDPRGDGRGRQGRRGDQIARRHGDAVRRHPAQRCHHVDDDQRPGVAAAAALSAGGARSRAWPPRSSAARSRTTS